jgi:hypothetical protein
MSAWAGENHRLMAAAYRNVANGEMAKINGVSQRRQPASWPSLALKWQPMAIS